MLLRKADNSFELLTMPLFFEKQEYICSGSILKVDMTTFEMESMYKPVIFGFESENLVSEITQYYS